MIYLCGFLKDLSLLSFQIPPRTHSTLVHITWRLCRLHTVPGSSIISRLSVTFLSVVSGILVPWTVNSNIHSVHMYSRITSTNSPSFFMITFNARLTNLTARLPQSRVCSCYLADELWHLQRSDSRNTLIYAHTSSRTLPTCDIGIRSRTLPAPEAGDFVELLLLYQLSGEFSTMGSSLLCRFREA